MIYCGLCLNTFSRNWKQKSTTINNEINSEVLFYVIFQVFDVRLPIGQAVYYANFFCIKMHYLVSLRQQYQASYVRMIYIYIFL